jgi:hypothetical protein
LGVGRTLDLRAARSCAAGPGLSSQAGTRNSAI